MEISQKLKDVFEEDLESIFKESFDPDNSKSFHEINNIEKMKKTLEDIYNKKYSKVISKETKSFFNNIDFFKDIIEKYNENKIEINDKEFFSTVYRKAYDLLNLINLNNKSSHIEELNRKGKEKKIVKKHLFYKEIIDNLKDEYVNNFRTVFSKELRKVSKDIIISKFYNHSLIYLKTKYDESVLGFLVEKEDYKMLITYDLDSYSQEGKLSLFLFKNRECLRVTIHSNFYQKNKSDLRKHSFTFENLNSKELSGINFSERQESFYFKRVLDNNGEYKIKVYDNSNKLVALIFKRMFKDGENIALSFTCFEEKDRDVEKHYAKYLDCMIVSRNNHWQKYFKKNFATQSCFRGHVVVKDFEQVEDFLDLYDLEFST
tara:strand:- start:34826 stop:35950 length:1125 start_codon:yes stop_codon:yes gene_type:complete